MTDAELTQAMAELQEVVRCRCDEAYRDRGLHDPQCECDSAEAVKIVANRIKTLTKERDELKAQVEQFRNTNRRLNRRVQLLEGWWQRRLERANYWRGLYLWGMRRKDLNVKAIEEAAYQRGYEDGFEEKFRMPKRWARQPRRINSGENHD